jgi:hypothetical protein
MLQLYPAELMKAYPVTRKVKQLGFDGPEGVDRIGDDGFVLKMSQCSTLSKEGTASVME